MKDPVVMCVTKIKNVTQGPSEVTLECTEGNTMSMSKHVWEVVSKDISSVHCFENTITKDLDNSSN